MACRWLCIVILSVLAACATAPPPAAIVPSACIQTGQASWYRPELHRTADGHHDGPEALVAAHRSLPFGTQVRVTDLQSGRSVVVRIDDRGPFIRGRIIDLSPEAARLIGLRREGTASVRLEIADPAQARGGCPFPGTGRA